jgi:hypothetical protein
MPYRHHRASPTTTTYFPPSPATNNDHHHTNNCASQAWFESKHDIDLSLELYGRELGEVDHSFLEDTLGVRTPSHTLSLQRVF